MTRIRVSPPAVLATLADLIAIPSVNPMLTPGAAGEAESAAYCARFLREAGLEVHRQEAAPGRPNVVGILRGTGGGRSLMLNGHLDTVGVEGMAAPFSPVQAGGRMLGRGSSDMKASIAAMLWTARAIQEAGVRLAGDLLIACVCDEEYASIGSEALVREFTADAAIVTEPTDLNLCLAHRGFVWVEVETFGRAAHGSRPNEGIDAIVHMGRVLTALEVYAHDLAGRPHPALVTPPSVHASTIQGGREWSMYPDHCRVQIERRTVTGETTESVVAEFQALLADVRAQDSTFQATVRPVFSREPFETDPTAPIAQTVAQAITAVRGAPGPLVGMTAWTDAALLQAAGIPTVLFGNTGGGWHSLDEYVEVDSVSQCADVLIETALAWCG
ncbi:MAG: ArgE/DapE family deacylase [Anaerolineae bacterium]|nr:ArgE/DapE family deacylase [Anaerolineae bacterium]